MRIHNCASLCTNECYCSDELKHPTNSIHTGTLSHGCHDSFKCATDAHKTGVWLKYAHVAAGVVQSQPRHSVPLQVPLLLPHRQILQSTKGTPSPVLLEHRWVHHWGCALHECGTPESLRSRRFLRLKGPRAVAAGPRSGTIAVKFLWCYRTPCTGGTLKHHMLCKRRRRGGGGREENKIIVSTAVW